NAPAVLVLAVADPGRLAVAVDHHHVAHVDRGLLGHDPTGLGTTGVGGDPGVLLDPVHTLDDHPVRPGQRRDHLPAGTLVLAGDHDDGVTLLYLHRYKPSGAREMIRMNFFSRSSRPTGPKMRVPRGSLSFLMSTAAFSSNRMYEPSGRRRSLAV